MMSNTFLLAAGSNAQGQLAIGHEEDAHEWTPTVCLLEIEDANGDRSCTQVTFPPLGTKVVALSGGANHSIAIVEDRQSGHRSLWGTGDTRRGQLGPHLQATGESVAAFAQLKPESWASDSHHLDAEPSTSFPSSSTVPQLLSATAIATAWESSYIALQGPGSEDDTLFSLGIENDFGQLGIGSTQSPGRRFVHRVDLRSAIRTFQQESEQGFERAEGDGSDDDGDDRLEVLRVEAGVRHVCAVVRLQRLQPRVAPKPAVSQQPASNTISTFLIGWGAARHGQLAPRRTRSRSQAVSGGGSGGAAKSVERVVWDPLVIDSWNSTVDVQVSCGREHTVCMLTHTNREDQSSSACLVEVFTLGSNRHSQQVVHPEEPVSTSNSSTQIAAMWNTTLVLNDQNTIKVWGAASRGQAGLAVSRPTVEGTTVYMGRMVQPEQARIRSLVTGSEHAVVQIEHATSGAGQERSSENSFWSWGWTEHGNIPGDLEQPDGSVGAQHGDVFEQPVRIWPSRRKAPECAAILSDDCQAHAVWAGCATTFIQVASTQQS